MLSQAASVKTVLMPMCGRLVRGKQSLALYASVSRCTHVLWLGFHPSWKDTSVCSIVAAWSAGITPVLPSMVTCASEPLGWWVQKGGVERQFTIVACVTKTMCTGEILKRGLAAVWGMSLLG